MSHKHKVGDKLIYANSVWEECEILELKPSFNGIPEYKIKFIDTGLGTLLCAERDLNMIPSWKNIEEPVKESPPKPKCECGAKYDRTFKNAHSYYCPKYKQKKEKV